MLKVLIVDDTQEKIIEIRKVLEGFVENPDDVPLCGCIREALKACSSTRYDLVILDLFIPNKAGEDPNPTNAQSFLKIIKEDDDYICPVFVIGITRAQDLTEYKSFFEAETMQVLYYWAERLVPRRWLLATCVAVSMGYMALAWWVDTDLYVSFWNLSHAVQYLPFYAMGNCLRDWLARLDFTGWRQATLLAALSIASVAIMAVSLPEPGDQQWTYGMAKVVAGAMIIPAYVCLCKAVSRRFGRRAVVESIVMGGTIYLAVQNYFIGALRNVMLWLGAGDLTEALWMRPIVALVVMVGIYPLSWLVQHHAKWMIGKGRLFGNP